MALPGFFFEYLVTGSCALFWLFGVFRLCDQTTPLSIDAAQLAIFAPALYVVGMLIDFSSRQLLKALRKFLKSKGFLKKMATPAHTSQAWIWVRSSDLGKQVEIRSSRDRIARGAVGNLLAATIVFPLLTAYHRPPWWYVVLIAGLFLTFVAVCMWLRFDYRTSDFQHDAAEALYELPSKMSYPSGSAKDEQAC